MVWRTMYSDDEDDDDEEDDDTDHDDRDDGWDEDCAGQHFVIESISEENIRYI